MTTMNLVTPKAGAKRELLLSKPPLGQTNCQIHIYGHGFHIDHPIQWL